jgi:hypothetical protein
MAYEKNTWARGDIVTSAKLNHMEDGIANAGETLVIGGLSDNGLDGLSGTSDKTWQEIDNALAAGAICVVVSNKIDGGHGQLFVDNTALNAGTYSINVGGNTATTSSADGYPTIGMDPPIG